MKPSFMPSFEAEDLRKHAKRASVAREQLAIYLGEIAHIRKGSGSTNGMLIVSVKDSFQSDSDVIEAIDFALSTLATKVERISRHVWSCVPVAAINH